MITRIKKSVKHHLNAQGTASAWTSAGFQKYLANTSWMFFVRVCTLVISFFVTIYVIRYLGPHNYGLLSYAVSFVGLFSFIASLGIDQIVYRELVKYPEKEPTILGSALFLKLIGGAIATCLTIVFGLLFHSETIDRLLIIIISLTLLGNAWQITGQAFHARVMAKYPYIIVLITAVTLALGKIAVIYFDKGIIYFALILLLEAILYAIYYSLFYVKHFGSMLNFRIDRVTIYEIFKDSFPLMVSTVSIIIYSRIDQVMLRHFLDATAVGIYDAAVRLSDAWYIIPNVILSSIFPAIVKARMNHHATYVARVKQTAAILTCLAVLVAVPSSLLSSLIIDILYGDAFAGSGGVLSIYIWSLIGFSLGQLMGTILVTENMTGIYLWTSLITMSMNVLLNLLLIPDYGVNGAALATLISYNFIAVIPFLYPKFRIALFSPIESTTSST